MSNIVERLRSALQAIVDATSGKALDWHHVRDAHAIVKNVLEASRQVDAADLEFDSSCPTAVSWARTAQSD